MASYSTLDGSKLMPELLPEDVETFLGKIKVTGGISSHFRSFLFSAKSPFK
jgi:hypothetical protein